ncbi:MAG TPA: Rne/Rng family ribonuclease [Ornithinibacter sp.]|nr:Rne/Rng family ribonuclease [Ornithinibacter sp.]
MASENDEPTTPDTDQAPTEKPKRRRAAKKVAAPATESSAADATPAEATEDGAAGAAGEPGAPAEDVPAPKAARKRATKKASTRKKSAPKEKAGSARQEPGEGDAEEAAEAATATEPEVVEVVEVVEAVMDETAEEDEAGVEAAPAVPSFGLLFQAPEPVAPRRRRATAPAQAPTERPAVEETPAGVAEPPAEEPTDDERREGRAAEERGEGRAAEERGTDDGEGGSRSRRRRGGRGRRGRGQSDEDQGTASVDSGEGEEEPSGTGPAESADEGESGSSRRRRRRRRGASSGDTEGEDPPGTVTRVREPRSQRDEPTAVKGSTRLEAKKQRRREGREAGRRRTIITEAEFLARRESVERVMVVRGRGDRTQIGLLEDGVLVEHYVSRETTASMAGNVYLGRVQNVLPSMEAAFVDIGKGRNAVLYAGEVNWDAAGLEGGQARRIENALSSGDTVLVQVTKDPIGHKGARLTSQISLPGRYLVYVPEGSMTGISRKLPDTERARLKAILKEVVPDSAGVIVRTAAEGASEEELRADVERLTKAWETISNRAATAQARKTGSGGAPVLLHGEPDLTVRVIRDVFTEDFTSLVVSGDKAWGEVSDYVEGVAPDLAPRLVRWTSEDDVFAAHRIDEALAKAMDRKVWLPSGGSLVIDRTEAMTVVDVNTGKFVGSGGNLEETVTKNNLEAAEEIVRQLRLRDIGGIIVVDFIDMVLESNRDLVVRRLLECLGRDRTKHQVAEVTSLGLVQMTRKRVGSGLIEVFSEQCEHCNGRGIIVHTEPVDRGGSSDQGGQGGPSGSRAGRGRRGSGSSTGGASTSTGDAPPLEEPRTPSGPTAAQIAAAAHAAALRRVEAGDAAVDAAQVGSLEPDAAEVGDEAAQASPAESEPEASEGSSPETTASDEEPEPTVEAAPESVGEAVPASAAAEPEPEVVAVTEPEKPRGRRKRGRVVAPAGPPRTATAEAAAD